MGSRSQPTRPGTQNLNNASSDPLFPSIGAMGGLGKILLVILGISFMVFVTFFGRLPALRHTPVAWLHRLMWVTLPNRVLAVDRRITSGRLTAYCWRTGQYFMYDRHPTVLIFYMLLLSVGEFLFLPAAWPRMGLVNKMAGPIAIFLPYLFLYLAASTDAGTIDSTNHGREMARYPYDFTLFHPGAFCHTCKLLKPARSKHCSVCKRCISRLDHHCIFINNCVGSANHGWFLLLLASTATLCVYGGILGVRLMMERMQERYPHWALYPWHANDGAGMSWNQWLSIWSWGLQDSTGMGAVTFLAVLINPLIWTLLGYHIWLAYCGTTTNESMKWSDLQAEMTDGFAFKRALPADRVKDLRVEPAWTRWPTEAEQIMVRTEDGKTPRSDVDLAGVGEWERVRALRHVENLYDIGFRDNLIDLMYPYHMFRHGETPLEEGRARRNVKRRPRPRK